MSLDAITQLILQYRYWILIPLSLIEGPIVGFIAGTLAALNYFNIYTLAVIFFIRDVGADVFFYAIGYFSSDKSFTHKVLQKIGVTEDHMESVRAFWLKRPGVTMFIGKIAYGMSAAFIIAAGIMKMPLRIFMLYGSIVAVLQYGVLLSLGYFLGTTFGGTVQKVLKNLEYVVAFGAVAIIAYLYFAWRMRKRFLKEEQELNRIEV